ncbi:MAG: hypothetical protein NWF00_05285 [Candidatus Bathyarchaeota archaeon]|nr:hypothetical protein [Candidatus Bathyarchaeota archaeon]
MSKKNEEILKNDIKNCINVYRTRNGLRKIDFDIGKVGLQLKISAKSAVFELCKRYAGNFYELTLSKTCGYIEKVPKALTENFVAKLIEFLTDFGNVEPLDTFKVWPDTAALTIVEGE